MTDVKNKWNRIYARESHVSEPAAVLSRNVDLIQTRGLALDIACGTGANAVFLASMGLNVHAWDISTVAINHLAEEAKKHRSIIETRVVNIAPNLFPGNCYDLILNCHYLDRSLIPAINKSLKQGGLVVFQTFTADKLADIGPTNPDFLLKKDELLEMFAEYEVLLYQDESQSTDTEDALCGRACLIGRKRLLL